MANITAGAVQGTEFGSNHQHRACIAWMAATAKAKSSLRLAVQVTPALCGMAATDFAKQLQHRLRQACPSAVIIDTFMGPADLACIYARTRLNFHPCLYDAYGRPPTSCDLLGGSLALITVLMYARILTAG